MSTMRHFLIISNPKKSDERTVDKVCQRLCELGFTHFITNDPKGDDIVAFSDILVIGGDGTINYAINALDTFDIPIGIIPAGSGNDYVKSVNIGKTLRDNIDTTIDGPIKQVDIGRCNDQLFLNGFGLGFDGQIAKSFEDNRTILKGHAAYYYHVIKTLAGFKPKPLKFTIDGVKYEEEILLLTIAKGTTFGGGFKLTPHAKLSDGQLAISLIQDLKPIKRFLNIHRLQAGTHDALDQVELLKGRKITIESQPDLIAHIDGELIGSPPFEIEILTNHLKIRANQ